MSQYLLASLSYLTKIKRKKDLFYYELYVLLVTILITKYIKVTQLWLILSCPMDCDPPGSFVYGIFQAKIVEWVAISQGDLPDPRIEPVSLASPALAGGFVTTSDTWEAFNN